MHCFGGGPVMYAMAGIGLVPVPVPAPVPAPTPVPAPVYTVIPTFKKYNLVTPIQGYKLCHRVS